jgi:hypothetical protein
MISLIRKRTYFNIIFWAAAIGAVVSGYVAATSAQTCNPAAISEIFKCTPLLSILACAWFGAIAGTAVIALKYGRFLDD